MLRDNDRERQKEYMMQSRKNDIYEDIVFEILNSFI